MNAKPKKATAQMKNTSDIISPAGSSSDWNTKFTAKMKKRKLKKKKTQLYHLFL